MTSLSLLAGWTVAILCRPYQCKHCKQEISLKKIYDEMTEDIFDMSSVRIFKEIEKKKWGMFTLCYVFGQLSSVKRLA